MPENGGSQFILKYRICKAKKWTNNFTLQRTVHHVTKTNNNFK